MRSLITTAILVSFVFFGGLAAQAQEASTSTVVTTNTTSLPVPETPNDMGIRARLQEQKKALEAARKEKAARTLAINAAYRAAKQKAIAARAAAVKVALDNRLAAIKAAEKAFKEAQTAANKTYAEAMAAALEQKKSGLLSP